VVAVALAGAALAVAGRGAPAASQQAPGVLEMMTKAKAVFEGACGVCHGLERPLSKTFDRAGWVQTVERMHDNGAEVDAAQRELVVAYLLAKNTFEAKCAACHGLDRPLGASKTPEEWGATVQRMADKRPGLLTSTDAAGIAAYLALTRPARQ
jgi:cytochrome c5